MTTQEEGHAQELERNPPNNMAGDDDGGNHSTSAGAACQGPYMRVNAIKHSNRFAHFYTGLENYSVFLHAFWCVPNCLKQGAFFPSSVDQSNEV